MLISPSAELLSPVIVECGVVLNDGLLLLWDAFGEAQRHQPPVEIPVLSVQLLVQAGMPHKELKRMVAAELIAWRDGQAPSVRGRRRGRRRTPGGYVLTRPGFLAVCKVLCARGMDADTTAGGQHKLQFLVVSTERPNWNAKDRELWWQLHLVKRFRHDAANQRLILTAFEEEGWPLRIDDPLPRHVGAKRKSRLHEAIRGLQDGQNPLVLAFHADGTTEGLRWEAII